MGIYRILLVSVLLAACNSGQKPDHAAKVTVPDSTAALPDTAPEQRRIINDTLNATASAIAGTVKENSAHDWMLRDSNYVDFSRKIGARWKEYDSTRVRTITKFASARLSALPGTKGVLFYPFSGPDMLYPLMLFPSQTEYILIGLEPRGTMPDFESLRDSLPDYFSQVNNSLYAILNFSFFRTESMRKDLRKQEVNGTVHLLTFFIKRMGNDLVSVRTLEIDSAGQETPVTSEIPGKQYALEIRFTNNGKDLKRVLYFQMDIADFRLQKNPAARKFLERREHVITYMKGASYLMHKPHFSTIRNYVLQRSDAVVQDDSGIALKYFLADSSKWNYTLFGSYTKPISMFGKQFQPKLDSLYRAQGSEKLDFGIGYNYRDKNSNFMVATKSR